MKIRQAKKILKRVLGEPIQPGSNELESVYMPTIRRLYKLSTWLAAKNRVERWKAAETKRRFKILISGYDLDELSWVQMPASRPFIGFDWGAGKDRTEFTHLRMASSVMIPRAMLEESHDDIADKVRRLNGKAYADRLFRDMESEIYERAPRSVYATNDHGNTQSSTVTFRNSWGEPGNVEARTLLEGLTELERFREQSDREFDKEFYGYLYPSIRDHLKPITRFLFLESAYQQCKEVLEQKSVSAVPADYSTVNGIAIERFCTLEEIDARANELRSADDFGFRIIMQVARNAKEKQ